MASSQRERQGSGLARRSLGKPLQAAVEDGGHVETVLKVVLVMAGGRCGA